MIVITGTVPFRLPESAKFTTHLCLISRRSQVEVVAVPAPPAIDPPVIEPKVLEAKIEISLSNGHHIRVSGAYDPDALCRLVRGLG